MKLKVVYSPVHNRHYPKNELFKGKIIKHVEVPERIENILSSLKKLRPQIVRPSLLTKRELLGTHDQSYIKFLKSVSKSVIGEVLTEKYAMDTYTPVNRYTYFAALVSASIAKTGAELIISGENLVYSLCRPPGHHAGTSYMGGYCYFNNAAIAANVLANKGKVAILDIDFHHGNGTQEIFYGRSDVLFVSIHANPHETFPYKTGFISEKGSGKGKGYNINYPIGLNESENEYLSVLSHALSKIRQFGPKYFVVSLGLDTYKHDPIGGFYLSTSSYKKIGKMMSNLNLQTLLIQEGGYDTKSIGENALSFVSGFK